MVDRFIVSLVITILSFIVCIYSSGYGTNCNFHHLCDQGYVCMQFEGCEWGRCSCEEPMKYNFTNATCAPAPPKPILPTYNETCHGECANDLVCKLCYWDSTFHQPVCRKADVPLNGTSASNDTFGKQCERGEDCGETLACMKSEDCTYGKCKCRHGFSFKWIKHPCKKDMPTNRAPIGHKCQMFGGNEKCVKGAMCSMCPGLTTTTCVGHRLNHTHPAPIVQHTTPGVGPPSQGVSAAVYVTIPIALVLIGAVVFIVIRRRGYRYGRGHFSNLRSESTTPVI